MSVRDSSTTSLAARRTSVKSRHFGIGAGFVDKDEALRVKIDLPFEPLLTRGIYIAAPLLGGVRCLFLSVIFLRWKKRQSEAMPADIPRRFNNSCNSASVISVFTVTASKINCECASIRCDLRSPPGRLGTTSPASLRRLRQRIALAALIPKRSAARRQDKPSSIAATPFGEDQRKAPWSCMLTSLASIQLESDSRRFGNPNRFIPVGKCASALLRVLCRGIPP